MSKRIRRLYRQWKDGKFYYWGIASSGYVKPPEVESKIHDEITPFGEKAGTDVYERDICEFDIKNQFGSIYQVKGVVLRGEDGSFGFVNELSPRILMEGTDMVGCRKVGDVYTNANLLKECVKNPSRWIAEEME